MTCGSPHASHRRAEPSDDVRVRQGATSFRGSCNNNKTQYQYDNGNRRIKVTYLDTTFDSQTYDALGRTTSKMDKGARPRNMSTMPWAG